MKASVGDKIVVQGHHVGDIAREGEIIAVESAEGEPPYRVRWEPDAHEDLFFPGPDAQIVHHREQQASEA